MVRAGSIPASSPEVKNKRNGKEPNLTQRDATKHNITGQNTTQQDITEQKRANG